MAKLTPKQKLFCDYYLISLNATDAAIKAGCSFIEKPLQYYIYFLVNSCTGKIIYIGKGKGKRADQHLLEYKKGVVTNAPKHAAIREVYDNKGELNVLYFSDFEDAKNALSQEATLIRTLKVTGLTNISLGVENNEFLQSEKARAMLARRVPFGEWLKRKERPQYQIEMYFEIDRQLNRLAYGL